MALCMPPNHRQDRSTSGTSGCVGDTGEPLGQQAAGRSGVCLYARSVGGELLRCQRSKHTEFVALRVGHHYPGDVGALPYVRAARAKAFKPSNLGSLILRS
jgi:hypothetical protein